MQVITNSVEVGGWSRSTDEDGNVSLTVPYLVLDVGGSWQTRTKRVADALPKIGARLSGEPGIRLRNIEIAAVTKENNAFSALLEYGVKTAAESEAEEGGGSITFTADTVTEKTTTDIRGRKLRTEYYNLASFGITRINHEADVDRPLWTVQIKKELKFLPRNFALTYTGAVNSRQWSGFPARTWLCRNIGASEKAGGRYDVEWLFSYNPKTWRLFTNTKIDGLIPADVRTGNGTEVWDVYPLKDFNAMGVSFSGK